jgi:hypothetical protein
MKILPIDKILKTTHPVKTPEPAKPVGHEFKTILQETVDNSTKIDTRTQIPPMISNTSIIEFNTLTPVENTSIIDLTERMLDILDNYQQELSDPNAPLRDIHPLIKEMEMEKERLIPLLDSLPDGDGLKDILNQILITTSVEIMKFNRGSYVNT